MATVQMKRANTDYANNVMPGVGDGQSMKCVTAVFTLSAALPIGTVLQSPLIQAGSTIVDVMVTGALGTTTVNVGTGDDPDYFIAAGAAPVARPNVATALPLTLTKNDTVDITTVAAATGTSGKISLTIYFLPLNA